MSKNKKKQQKQEIILQSVSALTTNGLKAFQQNDFVKAIATWEKIPLNFRPAAWLAEAHFRRGLSQVYGADAGDGLYHLQSASTYQPDNPVYIYHVGLVLQRQGDLAGAINAYQAVRKSTGPFAARAAYPLALASLQNGQDPRATPGWNELSPTEQSGLQSAGALQSRRRLTKFPPEAPQLWHALAAVQDNDPAAARSGLEEVLTGQANPIEKAIAHFYQGVLSAQVEDWEAANTNWVAAFTAGLQSARMHENLSELALRRAEDFLRQGDASSALSALETARQHKPDDKFQNELAGQIHQQLGFQAASTGQWVEAQTHWQTAVELDSGSFRLAYNLALSYEKSDNYLLAGQTWREALRRRPRRADHPDALSDEQVARIWQRAAQCYQKAGEFEEVAHTYQQAIKWAPDNVNLRLALAESLMQDGRLMATRNELERVLDRDPNNIPALLRLGEAYFRDEDAGWYIKENAKRHWEKALQIDPKNSQAKLYMGEWYMEHGEIAYSWDEYERSIEDYKKSLEYNPKNIKVLCYLSECYFNLGEEDLGEEFSSQAVAQAANFDDFASIIMFWLELEEDERAWDITDQAENRFKTIPVEFYLTAAEKALKDRRKSTGLDWIKRALEKAQPQDNAFLLIGELTLDVDNDLSR
ncbi:MAG: tetratricopeptide repeat protein, partial [Chloroflexota bacterium]